MKLKLYKALYPYLSTKILGYVSKILSLTNIDIESVKNEYFKQIHYTKFGFKNLDDFEKFHEILKNFSNVPYINCGGCGIVAYSLAEILDLYNIEYEFALVCDYKNNDFYSYNNICFRHIGIKIGRLLFDSNGLMKINSYDYLYYQPKKYKEHLKHLITLRPLWNNTFDRNLILHIIDFHKINIDIFESNVPNDYINIDLTKAEKQIIDNAIFFELPELVE